MYAHTLVGCNWARADWRWLGLLGLYDAGRSVSRSRTGSEARQAYLAVGCEDLEKGRRRHLPPVVGVRPGGDEDSPVSRDDSDSGWEGRENQREEEENSGRQLEPWS